MNNYERIKQMSVEEMEILILTLQTADCFYNNCEVCFVKELCCQEKNVKQWLLTECE